MQTPSDDAACDTVTMTEALLHDVESGWARVARVAVLLSGSGRTLANFLEACQHGRLDIEVVAVVSSKPDVRGLEIAAAADIPQFVLQRRDYSTDEAYTQEILNSVMPFRPDLLVLAGFLRKLVISSEWAGRVLNIHPALLPEMSSAAGRGFYGDKVHAEVLRLGVSESGATVHIVDNGYDTGPVLGRAVVPVKENDTVRSLADRVFQAECELYPRVIDDYIRRNRDWLLR